MLVLTAASAPLACAHCGLSVPAALRDPRGPSFCCSGCRGVYALLHEHGLAGYYAERARQGQPGRPIEVRGRTYDELDAPSFVADRCRGLEGGLLSVELYLEGVHC